MKIVKTVMGPPENRFADSWDEQEQALAAILGQELQMAIDEEILNETVGRALVAVNGWHQVILDDYDSLIVPSGWLKDNLAGSYKCFGHYWYFEKHEDAVAFLLRWR